ncbi:MAG: 16S rRNA (uracil(1498)-N(3))-methyltransferase [Pseudomonadales bacterium]|nr:16S rRNA (uracil(1498)-N(3))-methyltransferase [Gammaproteobacteria bacterium]NNL56923.1 16S rRNA (uracil(1498)-N(3))-methyltransferase [Pseudomonadales bacterium]
MNLLLLNPAELTASHEEPGNTATVLLEDWRATHIIRTLRASCGDSIRVGIRNSTIGAGHIAELQPEHNRVVLQCEPKSFTIAPPAPCPARLFVALPRPKAARRVIRLAAECGVKALHFINGYKVEKSYWSSPLLSAAKIDEQIVLGLQQAIDTKVPQVTLHTRFKPFVEDELPVLASGQPLLLAHPQHTPQDNFEDNRQNEPATNAQTLQGALRALQYDAANNGSVAALNVVLGPEGGFTAYELEKLQACGAQPFNLGPRIYRTEIAIATLLGELQALRSAQ